MSTIPQALATAVEYHRAGQLQAAEQIYRQILTADPQQVDAWHLLGVLAHQVGQHEIAVRYIGRAIQLKGNEAAFHSNLGNALRDQGKLDEAVASYRRALGLKPKFAEAHNNLGVALGAQKKLDEAIGAWRRALKFKPDLADALYNLGNALKKQGKTDEALDAWRRVLKFRPDHAEAWNNIGNALTETGKFDDAIAAWQESVRIKPAYAEAHNNLGNALQQQGKHDEAIASHRRALEIRPDYAEALSNLGAALEAQGRTDEAIGCYERALALKPDYAEGHYNLANALAGEKKLQTAVEEFRRALEIKPDYAEAYNNLGNALKEMEQLEAAIACWRKTLELKPNYGPAYNNLAVALREQGRLDEAVADCQRAIELNANHAEAHNTLGNALKDQQKFEEAIASYRRALELKPAYAEALVNLGVALQECSGLDQAIVCFERAVEVEPELAEAHNNLANARKDQGRLDDAVRLFRRAIEVKPDYAAAHSNLLYTRQYQAGVNLSELAAAHAEFNRRHAAPLAAQVEPHPNVRDPRRRLRVGFLSPDFGRHPVAYFLIRAFEQFDREQWETFCYSDRLNKDELTARFRSAATTWQEIMGVSDKDVAAMIAADRIDVLFDLAGHTARNRLLVMARKPAPVQITWIGYEGTTGLDAIDYLLADSYTIPDGAEKHYRERILRSPHAYVCYEPPTDAPDPGPLPAEKNGTIRFGSFNNQAKITPEVVQVWSKLLQRVPQSKLVLKYQGLGIESVRDRFSQLFAAQGIDPARLEFAPRTDYAGYLSAYREIDIALDPFPFGGGITTCDALWMGVPVVTCPGETFASRHGLTHLSNIGLMETIARDFDEYVEIAVKLAHDLPRLASIRAGSRERMALSPLCDGKQFAEDLTRIVRGVWEAWCTSAPSQNVPSTGN
jgi:protein O-GlcNAc transferase